MNKITFRGLLQFPDEALPQAEAAGRRRLTRIVAAAALIATFAYLTWRATATLDLDVWWVSVPLLLLEVHAGIGLALFTFSLWSVDPPAPPEPRDTTGGRRIAVLIATYNEPAEILLPTVAAAVALEPAHETWVLDDGRRPEVADLAAALGARYVTRPDNRDAKAGNINHALGVIDADLVAVLDADHVATPNFLRHTIGYFDDPDVAVVQTPQDFYNLDSFEHEGASLDTPGYSEQALFYRVLQAGKNRWDAAFWCGTNAIVRVIALRAVGGVATDTITEDIHTTIRMHRRGWRTVYHNEVLARGLAAGDAAQYQTQRLRWGTGAMQVLRSSDNPLFCRGLTFRQRLSYASTLLGWFDSWRSLGYLVVPMVVVLTGAIPIVTPPLRFAVIFSLTFALQRWALVRLSRGQAPQLMATVFEIVRMPANLRATLALLSPRARKFSVTAKGKMGESRTRLPAPRLLHGLLVASLVAGGWFAATVAGITPTVYSVPAAAYAATAWLAVNGWLTLVAVRRIRAERFGAERRASVRFPVHTRGRFNGARVRVTDLSLTGARLELPGIRDFTDGTVVLSGLGLRLRAEVRSVRAHDNGQVVVGVEFAPGQHVQRAALALSLLHARKDGTLPTDAAAPEPALPAESEPAVTYGQVALTPVPV